MVSAGELELRHSLESAREEALRERISRLESIIEGSGIGTWECAVGRGALSGSQARLSCATARDR